MRGGGVLGGRGGEGKVALSSLLLSSPYTPPPPPTTVALGRPETGSPLTPLAPHTHTHPEKGTQQRNTMQTQLNAVSAMICRNE